MQTNHPYRWHCQPCKELRPFIDRYWRWDIPSSTTLPMLMPGTGSECFFHYRQAPTLISGQKLPENYLVCPRQQTQRFLPSDNLGFIAIRFKNGQFRHFTDNPFIELQDRMLSLHELWGCTVDKLHEKLLSTSEISQQILYIEQFLLQQLKHHHTGTGLTLDALMERLYYSPNTPIDSLAARSGWSNRHLERSFKQTFALTPKRFARLARLHHTMRQISLQTEQNLLDIALERGFSDQSHFIHDVQALTGIKPSELQLLLRQQPHYYNPPSRNPG